MIFNNLHFKDMSNKKLVIYTDGGARGNPGPAGIGAVLKNEDGKIVATISRYIGETTNNQAEYRAVIVALEKASEFGVEEIEIFMDSELVVNQLNQKFKVKNKGLAPLFVETWNLSLGFKKITYRHVRREMNKEADKLVNKAIDSYKVYC